MRHFRHVQSGVFATSTKLTIVLFLMVAFKPLFVSAQAQASRSFKVIHNFTGGKDGGYPYAGLVIDRAGNLYGTANLGGDLAAQCPPVNQGCGTLFELVRSKAGYSFRVLYAFRGGSDGQGPYGRVSIGPGGKLYGTTVGGGNQACPGGCGTVFRVSPPENCIGRCPSDESVLYRFRGGNDAYYPTGDLAFDPMGNIYGTTYLGANAGTVYQLTPANGKWTESVLYNFTGQNGTGGNPYSGVVLDSSGNLYGTTLSGGINLAGTVFELSPAGSGWQESTLFDFHSKKNGVSPQGGLMLATSGALIGVTEADGSRDGGTVYKLDRSGSGWKLTTLYGLSGVGGDCGPWAKVIQDAAGNLYGTTQGYVPAGDYGMVFQLTHTSTGWKEIVLHRFSGGDGEVPYSTLVFDSSGKLYGTTNLGGAHGYGVVFEIAP